MTRSRRLESTGTSRRARALTAYGVLLALTLACGAGADDEPPPVAPAAPVVPPTPAVPAPVPPMPQGAVVFDGATYVLAGNEAGATGALDEYLPQGEVFESFTRMVSVRTMPSEPDAMGFANRFAAGLRAQTPPRAVQVSQDARGRVFLDFITSAGPITEFNIFIYQPNPAGPGLLAHQIVRRDYTNAAAFRQRMATERPRLLGLAAAFAFPTIR